MDLIEVETFLFVSLEEAKQKKKECWGNDTDDKAYFDGEIYAYQTALGKVKRIIERSNLIKEHGPQR